MIKVKHADPKCNQQQEAFMTSCLEQHRRFHELLFTHGNIANRYHSKAYKFEPIEQDWKEYLESCQPGFRKIMVDMGFEQGRRVLPFTRYVMEKKDVSMDEYVRRHMDPQDYAEYMAMVEHGPTVKPVSKPGPLFDGKLHAPKGGPSRTKPNR
jgi:hypothetical protein